MTNATVKSLQDLGDIVKGTPTPEQQPAAVRPKPVHNHKKKQQETTAPDIRLPRANKKFLERQLAAPENSRDANPYIADLMNRIGYIEYTLQKARTSLSHVAGQLDNMNVTLPPLEDYIMALQDHRFAVTYVEPNQVHLFRIAVDREAMFLKTAEQGGATYYLAFMSYQREAIRSIYEPKQDQADGTNG